MKSKVVYRDSYFRARAAARQWELVDDSAPSPVTSFTGLAANTWVLGGAPASAHGFLFEQFLALDLGEKVERPGMPGVTPVELQALFSAVLHTNQIDDDASPAERLATFLRDTDPHIAVTKHGRYEGLIEHRAGVNAILRQLLDDSGGQQLRQQ